MAGGTSQQHDEIVNALQVLEAALASPATGREDAWLQRVARDLAPVVSAVAQHCRAAEAPDGLVRELEASLGRPRALRTVSEDHNRLAQEAEDFLASLSQQADVSLIRTRAAELSAGLRAHQAHEADLIYETFFRDIGVGD